MKPKQKLFLWGMPGSGKSTIGRPLAKALKLPFFDLDEEIERNEEMNIPDIFSIMGEDYFREAERVNLQKFIDSKDSFLLSTGGGTPCFFDNGQRMNQVGTTLYLAISPKELTQRLCHKGLDTRPIFSQTESEDVLLEITEKLNQRAPHYDQAHIQIANDQLQLKELIDTIETETTVKQKD